MSKNGNENDALVNFSPTSGGLRPPDPLLKCFKTVPPHSFASSYAYALEVLDSSETHAQLGVRLWRVCLALNPNA